MILIINGSPKNKGNSAFIADKAKEMLKSLGETAEIINVMDILENMKTPFCTACATPCPAVCSRDNKLGESYEIIKKAKGMILISPVYFGSVTGEVKAYWDLLRSLRNKKIFYNMPGGAVAIGASRFGGQETTIKAIHDMMMVQGMVIAGDGYGDNMGHQGTAFQRPPENDSEGLRSLDRLVQRIVELSKLLKKEI